MDILFLFSVIVSSGAALSALVQALKYTWQREKAKQETIEQRIQRLSSSLSDAASLVSQIETEIDGRRSLVEKLQSDLATYNQLVELKKSEVEAIAQLLRGELRKEGRRSFWENAGVNFLFFVAGAALSIWLIR